MTLIQLQYFQALAHTLHYTKTAERLNVSQPGLSYAISELEKELGSPLFEKKGRKNSLTKTGKVFLPYVEKALSMLSEGVGAVKYTGDPVQNLVRLGYFHSLAASFVPDMMEKFYQTPDRKSIRFHFLQTSSSNILETVKKEDVDLGFSPRYDEEVQWAPLLQQRLYLVVPENSDLCRLSNITFSDIAQRPLIVLDENSNLREITEKIWAKNSEIPHLAFELTDCDSAVQFVARNMGISILPTVPSAYSLPVKVLPMDDPDFYRTIFLLWKETALSSEAKIVRDFLLENYHLSR